MSVPDPRLQRIALELDLVADTSEDWPEASRIELRALARKISEFDPFPHVDIALTPGQARVLTFLRLYIASNGRSPTRREICEGLGFASDNGALEHLRRLEQKGVITLFDGHRGIRINKRSLIGA